MFDIDLPYDRGRMHLSLPDESVVGVLAGKQGDFTPDAGQEELVERALDTHYDSPTLEQLCQGKRDIVIISSDHTRPVPSRVTMPILLRRIHAAAPEAHVRILVATGMHRASTHEELVDKYGERIVAEEEIVMHVATDDEAMVAIGTLPPAASASSTVSQPKRTCYSPRLHRATFLRRLLGVSQVGAAGRGVLQDHHVQPQRAVRARPAVASGHHRGQPRARRHDGRRRNGGPRFHPERRSGRRAPCHRAFAGDIHAAHEAGCDFVRGLAGVRAVDWTFNAWGGLVDGLYFPWDLDDQVAQKVCEIERVDSYRTEASCSRAAPSTSTERARC